MIRLSVNGKGISFFSMLFSVMLCVALAVTGLASCSSGSSDDDDDSTSESVTDSMGMDYTGSFTVNGARYSSISFAENGTYTMTGAGGTDTGTYTSSRSARSTMSGGKYTLTSSKTGTTFTVTISSKTIEFGGGASGRGVYAYSVSSNYNLPASVGFDPFNGNTYREMPRDHDDGDDSNNDVYSFSSGKLTFTHNHSDGRVHKDIYSYSYNANTQRLYAKWVSGSCGGKSYNTDNIMEYISSEMDVKNYCSDYVASHVHSYDAVYELQCSTSGSEVTLSNLIPSTKTISASQGGRFNNGAEIKVYSHRIRFSKGELRNDGYYYVEGDIYAYIIYDDGSNLELAIMDDDKTKTVGYISATYSMSGSGTSGSLNLSITSATSDYYRLEDYNVWAGKTYSNIPFSPHSTDIVKQ